jgi:hypothetical protein
MATSKALLALLLVSVLAIAVSCGDGHSPQGPADHTWQYFSYNVLRDYQYLDNTYFDLGLRDSASEYDLMPGDSITELELYISVGDGDMAYATATINCHLVVDPITPWYSKYKSENVTGTFMPCALHPLYKDFYFHPTKHYVIMPQPITGHSMGAYIKFKRWNGRAYDKEYKIGEKPQSWEAEPRKSYTLKLIANANPQPSFVTWNYVWRNVYSLGIIKYPGSLGVTIYKGDPTTDLDTELTGQEGFSFLHLLGIDKNNDGQVDVFDPEIVDSARGHLKFPRLHPFASTLLEDKVNSLYNSASWADRRSDSKYYLLVGKLTDSQ